MRRLRTLLSSPYGPLACILIIGLFGVGQSYYNLSSALKAAEAREKSRITHDINWTFGCGSLGADGKGTYALGDPFQLYYEDGKIIIPINDSDGWTFSIEDTVHSRTKEKDLKIRLNPAAAKTVNFIKAHLSLIDLKAFKSESTGYHEITLTYNENASPELKDKCRLLVYTKVESYLNTQNRYFGKDSSD